MIYNLVNNLSFRHFLELVQVPDSYVDALAQLGVDPANAAGDDEHSNSGGTPRYTGNFVMKDKNGQDVFYTGATFTAKLHKDGAGNISGARVTLGEVQPVGVYIKIKDKWVQSPNKYEPGQTKDVDLQTLNKMLNPEAGMPAAPPGGAPTPGMLPGGGM